MTGHNKNLGIKHTGNSALLVLALLFAALPGLGQTPGKAPTLTMATVPLVTAQRAEPTMVNPVSYTHLDVYKRQIFTIPVEGRSLRVAVLTADSVAATTKIAPSICAAPVIMFLM